MSGLEQQQNVRRHAYLIGYSIALIITSHAAHSQILLLPLLLYCSV